VKCKLSLKLEHLSKAWNGFALRNVNLDVADGEYFVLLGPNGAGKTLLLETIIGFHKPDEGKIVLNGKDVTSVPPERRSIGYVPQNCMLFPHMRVRQNVEFGLKMRGIAEDDRKRAVSRMLTLMELTSLAEKLPMRLSGGERQKVALARVLAVEPKAILLDEPLASIDDESSRVIKDELKRINHDLKVTLIHVTHNQMEAFSLAQRIAVMHRGQIVQIGTAKSLLSSPDDEFVARLMGYENVFKGKLVKQDEGLAFVEVDGHIIRAAADAKDRECIIGLRPEDVSLSMISVSSSDMNVFQGIVADCVDLGPIVSISVDVGFKVKATISKGSFLDFNLDRGREVWLSFRFESVKILNKRQATS
jgi:ABC-type Fe3+/spermidine/putrescine transport system ATPase subunit